MAITKVKDSDAIILSGTPDGATGAVFQFPPAMRRVPVSERIGWRYENRYADIAFPWTVICALPWDPIVGFSPVDVSETPGAPLYVPWLGNIDASGMACNVHGTSPLEVAANFWTTGFSALYYCPDVSINPEPVVRKLAPYFSRFENAVRPSSLYKEIESFTVEDVLGFDYTTCQPSQTLDVLMRWSKMRCHWEDGDIGGRYDDDF